MADVDKQVRALTAGTRYARNRILWTWVALGLLAVLTCVALLLAMRTADQTAENTETIALAADETADDAQAGNEEVVSYLRGEQGIPGVPGADGTSGTPGQPSSEPGPAGPKGDQGQPGTAGSSGPPGTTGPSGPAGPSGPSGPPGSDATGTQDGTQGSQGPKGDRGAEGPRGPEGATGPAGPQGPQGPAPPFAPPSTVIVLGQSANTPDTPKTANATCSSGRATGGGFAIVPSDPGLIVTASSPVANTGWSVTVEELSFPAAESWQVLAFATCLVP